MVNLSELKLNSVRKIFEVDIQGEMKEVVVFNLLNEDRLNLKNKITELNDKGLTDNEITDELYTDLFIETTNIVIDDDVIEILNNPSGDMLKILQEVQDILFEIQTETIMEKYQLICNLKNMEYTRLMLLQTEEATLITEKCKEVENNIKELNKTDKPKKKK